jgi:hypothetical protein
LNICCGSGNTLEQCTSLFVHIIIQADSCSGGPRVISFLRTPSVSNSCGTKFTTSLLAKGFLVP